MLPKRCVDGSRLPPVCIIKNASIPHEKQQQARIECQRLLHVAYMPHIYGHYTYTVSYSMSCTGSNIRRRRSDYLRFFFSILSVNKHPINMEPNDCKWRYQQSEKISHFELTLILAHRCGLWGCFFKKKRALSLSLCLFLSVMCGASLLI